MSTVIIVLALLAIGVGTIIYLTKKSVIKDSKPVLTTDESAFTPPEVAAEKEFIQAQQDALAKAYEEAAAELATITSSFDNQPTLVETTEVIEITKDVVEVVNAKPKYRKNKKPAPKK